MKITRLCVPVLLVLAACSPAPQEEEAVSARPTREENVARYLAKAKQNGRLAQERRRPIKAPAPVNVAEIKTHPDEMFFPALPAEMAAVKANLERRVRQEYGETAAAQAGAIIMEYHEAAQAAAKKAHSPAEMAAALRELDQQYEQKLNVFLDDQAALKWVPPTQKQLKIARAEMDAKNKEMLKNIADLYGPVCAEKAAPVLNEAVENCMQVFNTAKDGPDMQKRSREAVEQSDAKLAAVVARYGDPKGPMSEEDLQAMRAEMIAAYQEVEKKFNRLYGKEAVLEIRPFFNQILKNAAAVGAADTRQSYKREELARLNKIYQQQLADMQKRFNARIKQKAKR